MKFFKSSKLFVVALIAAFTLAVTAAPVVNPTQVIQSFISGLVQNTATFVYSSITFVSLNFFGNSLDAVANQIAQVFRVGPYIGDGETGDQTTEPTPVEAALAAAEGASADEVAAIAAAAAKAHPEDAEAIAAALAEKYPDKAVDIAREVAAALPESYAAGIAAAVAKAVPDKAAQIAAAVAGLYPNIAQAIANAVAAAVPSAAGTIYTSTNTVNPADTVPSPTPTPTPTPSPSPSPTATPESSPTPPEVSPS